MMTLEDLVKLSNQSVLEAPRGTRPAFLLEIPGKLTGRRVRVDFGPAKLVGKLLGYKKLGTEKEPVWISVARFFCDEAHR